MIYYYQEVEFAGNMKKIIGYKDSDGLMWWLGEGEKDASYLAWVAEGNEAEQWV